MLRRRRRALRHAFTILSALPLLLCVAVCVLWVASYWRTDDVRIQLADRSWNLTSHVGHFTLAVIGPPSPWSNDKAQWLSWPTGRFGNEVPPGSWERFGFRVTSAPMMGLPYFRLTVPHVYPAVTAAFVGIACLIRRRRCRKRQQAGLCPTCRYDLRAHAKGERCPECGTRVQHVA